MYIFIKEPDKEQRKLDIDEVKSMLRTGILSNDCLGWKPGLHTWVSLREIPELACKSISTRPKLQKPIDPFLAYFLPIGRITRWSWGNRFAVNFIVPCLIVMPLDKRVPDYVLGSIVLFLWIYLLIVTTAKRLHDMNATAWLAPIVFVPVVGFIILLIPGTTDTNQYGPPSK